MRKGYLIGLGDYTEVVYFPEHMQNDKELQDAFLDGYKTCLSNLKKRKRKKKFRENGALLL